MVRLDACKLTVHRGNPVDIRAFMPRREYACIVPTSVECRNAENTRCDMFDKLRINASVIGHPAIRDGEGLKG